MHTSIFFLYDYFKLLAMAIWRLNSVHSSQCTSPGLKLCLSLSQAQLDPHIHPANLQPILVHGSILFSWANLIFCSCSASMVGIMSVKLEMSRRWCFRFSMFFSFLCVHSVYLKHTTYRYFHLLVKWVVNIQNSITTKVGKLLTHNTRHTF